MSHLLQHRHFIFRAIGASLVEADTEKVTEWMHDLVQKIDMQLLIEPQTVYCSDAGNQGITSFCVITTSHIALHAWVYTGEIQLDIYSCKAFDIDIVFKHIETLIGKPRQSDFLCLNRDKIIEVQHDCQ